MDNLFEGLKEGDLEELVLPLISVDEYESKLDDDSVVLAFYVYDRDPAQDLNRFIQKGACELLDTDVSPAPNEDGYYLVFIELLRDKNLPKKITDVLGSLTGLTKVTNWKAQYYGANSVLPVTKELIAQHVRLQSQEDHTGHDDEVEESLTEFFRASDLEELSIEGKQVTMEARGVTLELQLADLGSYADVLENNAVMGSATRLDETANANCRKVQRMLGDLWFTEQRNDYLLVGHALRESVALFKL